MLLFLFPLQHLGYNQSVSYSPDSEGFWLVMPIGCNWAGLRLCRLSMIALGRLARKPAAEPATETDIPVWRGTSGHPCASAYRPQTNNLLTRAITHTHTHTLYLTHLTPYAFISLSWVMRIHLPDTPDQLGA